MKNSNQKSFVSRLTEQQIQNICAKYCREVCQLDEKLIREILNKGTITKRTDCIKISYSKPGDVSSEKFHYKIFLRDTEVVVTRECYNSQIMDDLDYSKCYSWKIKDQHVRTMHQLFGAEYTNFIADLQKTSALNKYSQSRRNLQRISQEKTNATKALKEAHKAATRATAAESAEELFNDYLAELSSSNPEM